ncbi:MAG: TlpA family protein disulfide reductase [Mongoliibacter sp.]|uniref:TlpA disulfide reductase family protein n=1 Tax=Mongoliibacter sp. TaxID=2022438 RepID=UPI0012F21717|nr:TlpA disulfide reductase family protein [Mongoliibacter sp.]TVP51206.1 MAG: TlpA family protein disulfide reductase [Mongoliibacter sp.]
MKKNLLTILSIIIMGCESSKTASYEFPEKYLINLDITPDNIPFELALKKSGEKWYAEVYNAEEVLRFDEVMVKEDSVLISLGVFDADLKAKIQNNGQLQGVFVKNYLEDYKVPFTAEPSQGLRFPVNSPVKMDLSGRWKTTFTTENDSYDAIGVFEQEGNRITGTFMTKLGDYRFLEGNVSGDEFYMSAFDGSHAFLFKGKIEKDGSLSGSFRSGPKYKETFTAERNESFELPDAYSLNYLKEGYEKLDFSFPDINGNKVSLSDERFQDKVILVQLFGTWCPNCMDETKFLGPWYEKNKNSGIEIIGLAFESNPDFEYASSRVKKSMEKLDANYTFLIAGESNKEKASQALPALNQVIAFPTLIYLDKKGKVRHIHTGFNGPGTGIYFEKWVGEHNILVKELLSE